MKHRFMTNKENLTKEVREINKSFSNARADCFAFLKKHLAVYGENGLDLPYHDCGYAPIAEINPRDFRLITSVRYYNETLEMLLCCLEDDDDKKPIWTELGLTDYGFLMDEVADALEYNNQIEEYMMEEFEVLKNALNKIPNFNALLKECVKLDDTRFILSKYIEEYENNRIAFEFRFLSLTVEVEFDATSKKGYKITNLYYGSERVVNLELYNTLIE